MPNLIAVFLVTLALVIVVYPTMLALMARGKRDH